MDLENRHIKLVLNITNQKNTGKYQEEDPYQ